jgi:peptidoglycan/xylan/chitin deacetylase (PgdA/CDA1 family)
MHWIWDVISSLTAGRLYTRARKSSRAVYLTFDDGPHPERTQRVLNLLSQHGARATFFLQGSRIETYPEVVADIVARGHTIGNHSFSHVRFTEIPLQEQIEEINRTNTLLQRFDGRTEHAFRPPYGRLSPSTIALCVWNRQSVALWTHDSLDFKLDATAVVGRLLKLTISPGDILLFHDDAEAGLLALEQLLPRWRNAGLELASL